MKNLPGSIKLLIVIVVWSGILTIGVMAGRPGGVLRWLGELPGILILIFLIYVTAWFFSGLVDFRQKETNGPSGNHVTQRNDESDVRVLVGSNGKCVTDLRPMGRVLIAGREIECMAEFPPIDRDSIVRVVAFNGNIPVVRKVEEQ